MIFQTIIPVDDLYANLSKPAWAVVDCRFSLADPHKGELEYEQGHIPGSYYAHLDRDLSSPVIPGTTGRHPLPDVEALTLSIQRWGVNKGTQVIAYDHSNGGIAARLWWLLRWLGHEQVAVLDGGWTAWKGHGFPEEESRPPMRQGTFRPSISHHLTIDADKVDKIRLKDDWTLVDARANERYLGLIEPIDPIAGHIEGAVNHPFTLNVDDQGFWKPASVLKSAFQKNDIATVPSKTVFYCGSGVTACHDILAYKHAGLGDAVLYPGSWSEWITRR